MEYRAIICEGGKMHFLVSVEMTDLLSSVLRDAWGRIKKDVKIQSKPSGFFGRG
jgi:hypothetical protein